MTGRGISLLFEKASLVSTPIITDILGHLEAEQALLSALRGGRMPHAWLFWGRDGIGKAALARLLAAYVLQGGDGSGGRLTVPENCPAVRLMDADAHPGFLSIQRVYDDKGEKLKAEIPVDEVRRIAPFLRLKTEGGGWRVVLVDGADCLNRSGQNALLKTLEEPPERTLILLTASNRGSLLPTIRSRCRTLFLQPLDDMVMDRLLTRLQPDLPLPDRSILKNLSGGSIGMAVSLTEGEGLALYQGFLSVLEKLPRLDPLMVYDFAEKMAKKGGEEAYALTFRLFLDRLGRLISAQASANFPPLVPGEARFLDQLSTHLSVNLQISLWERLQSLYQEGQTANLDRRLVVMNCFAALDRAIAA
jgi:DNA polymerase III subunit delta'